MNTPVFSLVRDCLSISDCFLAASLYSSTAALFSSVVNSSTNGFSGAKTTYVTPFKVSTLVVNTLKLISEFLTLKLTSAPVDLPIQCFCIATVFSGQSKVSNFSNSSSAYSVILKNH